LPDAIEPNGTVHHASPPSTFNEWGLGCLKIARRTDNAALRNKAEAIIAQIEAPTPTWTRTNWGAVP
jgi:hypothetical protein